MLGVIESLVAAGDAATDNIQDGRGTLLFSDPHFRDLLYVVPSALEAASATFQGRFPAGLTFCAGCWITPSVDEKRGRAQNRGRRSFTGQDGRSIKTTGTVPVAQTNKSVPMECSLDGVERITDGMSELTLCSTNVEDAVLDVDAGGVDALTVCSRPLSFTSSGALTKAPNSAARVSTALSYPSSYTCKTCGASFSLRRTLMLHQSRSGCV